MCRQSSTVCLVKSPTHQHHATGPLAERPLTPAGPRRRRGKRHPFVAVLPIACSAVVTGAKTFTAIGGWATKAPRTSWPDSAPAPRRRSSKRLMSVPLPPATPVAMVPSTQPRTVLARVCHPARQMNPVAFDVGRSRRGVLSGMPGRPARPPRMAAAMGFSLQGMAKTRAGSQVPDRDAQFRHINTAAERFLAGGLPVVSVDTKQKEPIGDFARPGRTYRPKGQPITAPDHDFVGPDTPVAIPYGIYDLGRDSGWVNVGTDRNTAAFAVESLRRWWKVQGHLDYPSVNGHELSRVGCELVEHDGAGDSAGAGVG
ncbi:hypothetical protein ACFYQA_12855 [Streptomyces sp. NPDC005774]|uniref:ISAzo13-like element transposase-related protein n=1 Tax=Streptomyces sp. NPDC005774 TaxID=3364728 RepID=UPI00367B2C6B